MYVRRALLRCVGALTERRTYVHIYLKSPTCNQQCRIWTNLGVPRMHKWTPWDHRPFGPQVLWALEPLGPNGPREGLTGNTTNAFCARICARRLDVGVLLGQAASRLVIGYLESLQVPVSLGQGSGSPGPYWASIAAAKGPRAHWDINRWP
jgi:hypothetical protein